MAQEKWRLIVSGPCSGPFNMALDEALAFSVIEGRSQTTLRFYEWETLSVTLGYFQKYQDINSDYCESSSIPVIRRLTGGRAVLHGKDLTYSFCAATKDKRFGPTISAAYQKISTAFLKGFHNLGLGAVMTERKAKRDALKNPSCFKAVSLAEVTLNGKKIIGSAQKRWSDGILQQGSIMVDFDPQIMSKIFYHTNNDMIKDIGRIKEFNPSVTFSQMITSFIQAFEETFNVKLITTEPDSYEYKMAKELEIRKYSSSQWNRERMMKDEDMMKALPLS